LLTLWCSFSAAIAGLSKFLLFNPGYQVCLTSRSPASLRAYGVQEAFVAESLNRIDRYTRVARVYHDLDRWIQVRIDALGGLFAATVAGYLLYYTDNSASNTGFSLNLAIGFTSLILGCIHWLSDLEGESKRYVAWRIRFKTSLTQGFLQFEAH